MDSIEYGPNGLEYYNDYYALGKFENGIYTELYAQEDYYYAYTQHYHITDRYITFRIESDSTKYDIIETTPQKLVLASSSRFDTGEPKLTAYYTSINESLWNEYYRD